MSSPKNVLFRREELQQFMIQIFIFRVSIFYRVSILTQQHNFMLREPCTHRGLSLCCLIWILGLPRWLSGKESACQCRRSGLDPWVKKTPLEEERASHSSILAWETPWTEEPGGLPFMLLQKSRT